MKYLILILFYVLITGCVMEPSGDERLKIVNNAGYTINVHYDPDSIPVFPSVNATEVYINDSIKQGDTLALGTYDLKPWPQVIERGNKKLNLFVYSVDSLRKYAIDSLIKRKIYLRIELSEHELNRTSWVVNIK